MWEFLSLCVCLHSSINHTICDERNMPGVIGSDRGGGGGGTGVP